MGFWMALWTFVLLFTVVAFGVLSIWVTIQGARDITSLIAALRQRHTTDAHE